MRLQGITAIVTGAASGFGRGIAERFAEEGARVAVLDLNADGACAVAKTIGGEAIAITADVTQADDVNAAFATAVDAFGQVDILVNNAGWSHRNQPLTETDYATFKTVYAVNVDSIYHFTQAAVPHWRTLGHGVMINIGSTAGISPRAGLTWYNSSKGAVNLMTRSLAVELAPDGVRVNCIAPVIGETGLLETFMGTPATPENREKFLTTIPMGRFSTPDDIAGAALYFASDDSSLVTGVILQVDGGRTI